MKFLKLIILPLLFILTTSLVYKYLKLEYDILTCTVEKLASVHTYTYVAAFDCTE